ncbi:MAG: CDP-diacylglycerol--glycerol-3-phosphate 3-phosphatidyltransferase [Clostridia bacterium]|nr:CDP-diacylglycerol--glycerol-3-phosphate 3-phosphatidyltransferase [Clostridia bacterium]MBQ3506661.1 CDP-diacylglycerol--glycerol-3-phosphate 3-phosphatidyltransferase [Clostridia bacterium]
MNLPNKISLTRICLIPVFVAVFFLDGVLPYNYAIAAAIFVIAACTDFIDGHIARSRGLVTNLGKFLDPIADKVLVATATILLLTLGQLYGKIESASLANGVYIATAVSICIILARELIISAFRQIAATNGIVMAAEKLGKYKTACQDAAIAVMILAADITGKAGQFIAGVGFGLFAAATVLTVWSGISYVWKYRKVLKDA